MICFAWSGFPQYAARCVGAFVEKCAEEVIVIATRPRVPIEGMEDLCRCRVVWVETDGKLSDNVVKVVGETTLLFVSGWAIPVFNRISRMVRSRGGKVVAFVDNNYIFSVGTLVRSIWFRMAIRHKFDGFFVPGRSGRDLLRFYGVNDSLIREGMYSADSTLFANRVPITDRPRKVIYVGQLCERKNVVRMCEAFVAANSDNKWMLEIYGCGPLRNRISNYKGVIINDFVQPQQLAQKYNEARIFVLPSIEEHWGLVVHEAALSGCVLMLSDRVGAAADLLGADNGFVFNPKDRDDMVIKFRLAMGMDDRSLVSAMDSSLLLARRVSIGRFVVSALSFCN